MINSERRGVLMLLVRCCLLALLSCSAIGPRTVPPEVIDMLQQDWRYTAGVTAKGDGLHVAALAPRIVAQDGRSSYPNPPTNLAGTHLEVRDDFVLTATIRDATADAAWTISDSPPIIADEFRIEPASLRLTLRGDDLEIAVFDGSPQLDASGPRPVYDERVTVSDPAAELSVRRFGNMLEVKSGGAAVSAVPFGEVFESGELWFGFSSDAGSFLVDSLTATVPMGDTLGTAGPAVVQARKSADGLQALATRARPGFRIGAAVALGPLASDPDYARAFLGNFGALTPENAMKPQFLSPKQGVYTFEEADAILAIAEREGLSVHGHTIAFTEAMPRWMQELRTDSEFERRASAEALLDYVTTVVTHFRGRLDSIDIVNEPLDVGQGANLQENVWYRLFGPDYPAVVSKAVYEADPEVKQFINENGAEMPGRRQDALLRLALDTNSLGGHIFGVGLQAHVYDLETDAISAEGLAETISRFGDAGLHVRISENDVTSDQGEDAQARQYSTVLATCLRSMACVSYTTWGVDNRYNWWIDEGGNLRQGRDYLFQDGRAMRAHRAMQHSLGN